MDQGELVVPEEVEEEVAQDYLAEDVLLEGFSYLLSQLLNIVQQLSLLHRKIPDIVLPLRLVIRLHIDFKVFLSLTKTFIFCIRADLVVLLEEAYFVKSLHFS